MNDVLAIIGLIILLLVALFIIPQLLMARAMKKVVKIFRENRAIDEKHAKTVEELNLQQKGMIDRMMKPRDYKPKALQYMIGAEMVRMTEEGKLYLVEEKLRGTKLE